ncbi:MAG: hypothetical protein Q4B28_03095 [bacterium]|nr:hypothetical protein [bacterium]
MEEREQARIVEDQEVLEADQAVVLHAELHQVEGQLSETIAQMVIILQAIMIKAVEINPHLQNKIHSFLDPRQRHQRFRSKNTKKLIQSQ